MNPQGDVLRDNLWQFIGVLLAFVFGVLALLAAIVALPDPGRAICTAISVVVIGLSLIGIYIILFPVRAKRILNLKEKLGIGVMTVGLLFIAALILNPVIAPQTVSGNTSSSKQKATQTPTQPPAFTETPTTQTTPMSELHTITKNLHLPCVAYCDSYPLDKFDATLTTIVINTSENQTTLNFTVTYQGANSCPQEGTSIALETTDGQQIPAASGTILDHSPFAPGQTMQQNAIFNFVPASGSKYTLHTAIPCYGDNRDMKEVITLNF